MYKLRICNHDSQVKVGVRKNIETQTMRFTLKYGGEFYFIFNCKSPNDVRKQCLGPKQIRVKNINTLRYIAAPS